MKYKLRDTIGPIPNCICQSIIVEYSKYYLKRLEEHEREQYFQIENVSNKAKANKSIKNIKLITYYDLVMAFASRAEKCSLKTIDYRQCIWSHSTLEERIKTKKTNKPVKSSNEEGDDNNSNALDSYDSSDLDDNKMVKSLRSKQKPHLSDLDLRVVIKNQKNLDHLDICPCILTNKSILLINKYLTRNLKSLRFQNCCNWQQESSQPQAERNIDVLTQQDENQINDTLNTQRLDLRGFLETDEDDDMNDDDDEDEDDDHFYHRRSNQLNVDSKGNPATSEIKFSVYNPVRPVTLFSPSKVCQKNIKIIWIYFLVL